MENEVATPAKAKSKMLPVIIVAAVVVIILVGAIAFSKVSEPKTVTPVVVNETPSATVTPEAMMAANYKDGEYKAEGMYTSPGGAESIDVTITLKDGVVEKATVVSNATRPISKKMQAAFIGGYKEQVIGKKLEELDLKKVSSSSLAPKGFNDAVEKIKAEAKA